MHFFRIPASRFVKAAAGSAGRRRSSVLRALVAAVLLAALGSSFAAPASAATGPKQGVKQWQQALEGLKMPGKGCFDAAYPKVAWKLTKCKVAQKTPFEPPPPLPSGGAPPPQLVGGAAGATDYSAVVSGLLTSAVGSFDSESAGVTESGPTPEATGPGPVAANKYTLQLNSQTFTTPACSTSPACVGWAQFVYDSNGNDVYIQYWLEHYDATCPSAFTQFTFPSDPTDIYCYTNSPGAGALTVTAPTAAQLSNVTLTGNAPSGGNDAVVMADGGTAVGTNTEPDSLLHLANSWNTAEFGVFGDGYGTEATFSTGTDLKVRVTTHSGTTAAPTCVQESFTGETNSLNLAGAPALTTGAAPAIVTEQNTSPGLNGCAAANGWGEIHLNTFRNLAYNFQASGDFDLATVGSTPAVSSSFNVQARLVTFTPNPSLSVSRAVAAQVGHSQVAVCLGQRLPLEVNRQAVPLASGAWLALPGGGTVSRTGNAYLIRDAKGDSVQATPDSYLGTPYLDVQVGLGRWPAAIHGLLANAGTNADAVATSGGAVLSAPFQFGEFYKLYGTSWRVPAKQDLLSACGDKVVSGNPPASYEASNLPPRLYKAALAVCVSAGVKAPALLDACTLDVAVLGKGATTVYRTLPAKVTWGKIVPPPVRPPTTRR